MKGRDDQYINKILRSKDSKERMDFCYIEKQDAKELIERLDIREKKREKSEGKPKLQALKVGRIVEFLLETEKTWK